MISALKMGQGVPILCPRISVTPAQHAGDNVESLDAEIPSLRIL